MRYYLYSSASGEDFLFMSGGIELPPRGDDEAVIELEDIEVETIVQAMAKLRPGHDRLDLEDWAERLRKKFNE